MVAVSTPGLSTGSSIDQRLKELDIRSPIDPEAGSQWNAAPRLESLAGSFLARRPGDGEAQPAD